MADGNIFLDILAQLIAVYTRHHHIADNDVGHIITYHSQCFLAVGRRQHLFEVGLKYLFQKIRHFRMIVDNQYLVGRRVELLSRQSRLLNAIVTNQFVQIGSGLAHDFYLGMPYRQIKIESGPYVWIVVSPDLPSMLLNENLGIGKAYTGTVLLSLSLIKTGKQFSHIDLIQSASLVGNGNTHFVATDFQLGTDGDCRTLRTVLQSIRQQIAQYNLTLVLIETDFLYPWIKLKTYMHLFRLTLIGKILRYLLNPGIERIWLHMQLALAYLHLAHIEHHVNQCFHTLRLTIYGLQRQILLIFGSDSLQNTF